MGFSNKDSLGAICVEEKIFCATALFQSKNLPSRCEIYIQFSRIMDMPFPSIYNCNFDSSFHFIPASLSFQIL